MSVAYLMDEHVNRALALGLRRRGVDVRTVQEENMDGCPDSEVLEYAGQLNRLVVTNDRDFLPLSAQIVSAGETHAGIIYFDSNFTSFKKVFEDLETIGKVCDLSEFTNRVEYLPL